MKIARQPRILASTLLNGTHPTPAPSLRELSSECETEGVYFDEWKTPFVGAMKIARNLPLSGRHVAWYAPHPGSLSEGAVERMRD